MEQLVERYNLRTVPENAAISLKAAKNNHNVTFSFGWLPNKLIDLILVFLVSGLGACRKVRIKQNI